MTWAWVNIALALINGASSVYSVSQGDYTQATFAGLVAIFCMFGVLICVVFEVAERVRCSR